MIKLLALVLGALALLVLGRAMVLMPGKSYRGPFKPLGRQELACKSKLQAYVGHIAGTIGPRDALFAFASLRATAQFIRAELERIGYQPSTNAFTSISGEQVENIYVEISGTQHPDTVLVVGAHYDTVPITPGADDNASAVAALLVLAEALKNHKPSVSLILAAFVNEEPPYFRTYNMGSLVFARMLKERNRRVAGMISLETIGFFSDQAGSQNYPIPVGFLYPDRGDFIGFIGNFASRGLVRRAIGVFRKTTEFPSEGAALPGFITGVGWSDQWSFWQLGWPAIMITDTALFRNPYYHSPGDTTDKLDYDRLARVVYGLEKVIAGLAGGSV